MFDSESNNQCKRTSRPVRKPMGDRTQLQIPDSYIEDGYVNRIVNDEPGRLDAFKEAGWDFIYRRDAKDHDGLGSVLSYFSGVTQTNKTGRSYAMRITNEWYSEDQLAKAKVNDLVDDSIRSGVEGVQNAYTPNQSTAGITKDPVTIGLPRR